MNAELREWPFLKICAIGLIFRKFILKLWNLIVITGKCHFKQPLSNLAFLWTSKVAIPHYMMLKSLPNWSSVYLRVNISGRLRYFVK